jgi:hypothetical protein
MSGSRRETRSLFVMFLATPKNGRGSLEPATLFLHILAHRGVGLTPDEQPARRASS